MPRNREEHRKNSARESYDEHSILNDEPTSPEFLAAIVHELSTKSSCNAAISTTTTIMATLSAFFPSVGNSIILATAAKKFCHHHLTVFQGQNQVQDLKTRKPFHLSGPSCQF
jgi:hypothetical protein